MSSKLTKQSQCFFAHFDNNKNAKISLSEFQIQECLESISADLSVSEAESVGLLMDCDGDGELGLDDFWRLIDTPEKEEKEKDLKEAFKMYEFGESGYITPNSLKNMLWKLGERKSTKDCASMIREFDLDGDGVLNFDEFKLVIMAGF